ncbi:MAG: hypothetical protein ACRETT_03180 [Steroidobacteraceae bacterium]
MNRDWHWTWRYAAVIVVVIILAGVLGGMSLFKAAAAVPGKLTAAHIVKFLGYSGVLAIFFLLAQRAALQLRSERTRAAMLATIVIPFATFVVVASAHGVLLPVLKPFLSTGLRAIYNWIFVAASLAAAAWLVLSILQQSGPLQNLTSDVGKRAAALLDNDDAGSVTLCACGAANSGTAKFCDQCGRPA